MTDTSPYANGVCTYGESRAPGSGCIKPAGHDGAHCVTPGDIDAIDDDKLCPAEWPGDDTHVGQLCTRPVGHEGPHQCAAEITGTPYSRTLTWVNTIQR